MTVLQPLAVSDPASLAVSALAPAAALITVTANLVRRRPSLGRRVVMTGLSRPISPAEKLPRLQRDRELRRGMAVVSAVCLVYIVIELSLPMSHTSGLVLKPVAALIGAWGFVISSLFIVNYDARRAKSNALSTAHSVIELTLAADDVHDVVAELHRFLRRYRFGIYFHEFDPEHGVLACNCIRWWYGGLVVPQYLSLVGDAAGSSLRLTALADVRPTPRYDFGLCEKNLKRLVRYFSLPPA